MEADDNKLLTALYRHYLVMKTFHFQTADSFRHTKVDTYLQSYLANMDKLMEVVQGIHGKVSIGRITIDVRVVNDSTVSNELSMMLDLLEKHRNYGSAISAIIDMMQADLCQLAYLFTFK